MQPAACTWIDNCTTAGCAGTCVANAAVFDTLDLVALPELKIEQSLRCAVLANIVHALAAGTDGGGEVSADQLTEFTSVIDATTGSSRKLLESSNLRRQLLDATAHGTTLRVCP